MWGIQCGKGKVSAQLDCTTPEDKVPQLHFVIVSQHREKLNPVGIESMFLADQPRDTEIFGKTHLTS